MPVMRTHVWQLARRLQLLVWWAMAAPRVVTVSVAVAVVLLVVAATLHRQTGCRAVGDGGGGGCGGV